MLSAVPRVIGFRLGPNVVEDAVYPCPLVDVHGKPLFESGMLLVLYGSHDEQLSYRRQLESGSS
jgi:hypothetical protein